MHALSHLFICCSRVQHLTLCSRSPQDTGEMHAMQVRALALSKSWVQISHCIAATKNIKLYFFAALTTRKKVIIVVYPSKSLCRAKSNAVNAQQEFWNAFLPEMQSLVRSIDPVPHRSPCTVLYLSVVDTAEAFRPKRTRSTIAWTWVR